MATKARKAFDENAQDIQRLLELHESEGGKKRGRRFGLEVLNKSAIVLITAFWEAYCEDLADEALKHIVTHVKSAHDLPKLIKQTVATELKNDKNEIAIWKLADDGWRSHLASRLADLRERRNRDLNTPKAENVDKLFRDSIGLEQVSKGWHWKPVSPSKAGAKLDYYIVLRGAIAHRGTGGETCTKAQVTHYLQHVKRIVGKTGGEVNRFVKSATGKPLWKSRGRSPLHPRSDDTRALTGTLLRISRRDIIG